MKREKRCGPVFPRRLPRGSRGRKGLAWLLTVALLSIPQGQGVAQQGVVAGIVVDALTQRPLAGAQVVIAGTSLGGLSNAAGRFRIEGLPGDQAITLTVVMLGYRTMSQEARVGDTNLRLQLSESAIELDALVVTGTAGGTLKRALGTTVAQVDAAEAVELSPATNLQQLLSGRVAGMAVLAGSGNVGSGSAMRVRGVSSITLANEPLIYIDGVRVNNDTQGGPNIRQGRQVNRLNDLNPEDIESIEVIKGPAAATLYGTEASNGVIQIITKRGRSGAPVFSATIKQGATWMMDPAGKVPTVYSTDPSTGQLLSVNLYENELAAGNAVFRTGHNQSYDMSVSGGTDIVRYFVSGEWGRNEGIVDYNWQDRLGARANVGITPSERFDIDANLGYVQSETRFAQAASGWGIWDQLVWGSPARLETRTRGFLRVTPEAAGEIDSRSEIARFTGGLRLTHRPTSWLNHRLQLGLDHLDEQNQILFPRHPDGSDYFFGSNSLGNKTAERNTDAFYTVDYAATASYAPTAELTLETSAGAQYYVKRFEDVAAQGRFFPAPSVTEISGAAQTFSSEESIENKTLGLYVQEQVGWQNRLFLTAAVRGDDNSAFGQSFDFVVYPKFSASWVVSEESFWNVDWVEQLKVRGAWGKAGQQPDVFAAVRLYNPTTGPGDASVATPNTIGNPDLKPEVGEEIEVGFDASVLDGRMSVAFSYYSQKTKDAIVAKQVAPSSGFSGTQFVNLGELKNWGYELNLDARLVERDEFTWGLGFTYGTNDNEVVSTGGLGTITLNTRQEHREGYPIAAYFAQRVVSADLVDGEATNILCAGGPENNNQPVDCGEAPKVFLGVPTPTWEGAITTDLTFFRNFRLFALVDFMGGNTIANGDIEASHHTFRNSRAINERIDPVLIGADQTGNRIPNGLYDAGFAKLREVSATYTLPETLADRIGVSRATVSVSARNLATLWRAQDDIAGHPIPDPEVRTPASNLSGYVQTVLPPFSTFETSIRLTF